VQIDVDLREGGAYRLSMNRDSGARLVTVHGRFLEIEPPRKLVYTWRWDGIFPDMPETIVTVEFRAAAGGTELALRQGVLELPMCGRHLSGWLVAFGRLGEAVKTPADVGSRSKHGRHTQSRDAANCSTTAVVLQTKTKNPSRSKEEINVKICLSPQPPP
jgi:Activator of Hsp90 ATPase homolog 1-like protein